MSRFASALGVANAVLYEGYLLYPYTASAPKNRIRWQFGVVVPEAYARAGTGEPAHQQTEILLDPQGGDVEVEVLLRFLQVEERRVEAGAAEPFAPVDSLEVDGTAYLTFDEALERELSVRVQALPGAQVSVPVALEPGLDIELLRDAQGALRGRIVRERRALRGSLTLACDAVPEAGSVLKVAVRFVNESDCVAAHATGEASDARPSGTLTERDRMLRTAFVSTHTLLAAHGGSFLSALDPPEHAAAATAGLVNQHTWPVLVGEAGADAHRAPLVLSSPIILYDFPAVAPQTDADAFDATEIDELLNLSVLSLSDSERAEARATDPRSRALIERAERFGPEQIARLHAGALHRIDYTPSFGDPLAALDVPSIDCVFVDGAKVTKGSAVRLHPKRRADAWDMFLAGKLATVCAVHQDMEDQFYVAVTVDDDPASDLHEWYGRSFFFYPDEIEPIRSEVRAE